MDTLNGNFSFVAFPSKTFGIDVREELDLMISMVICFCKTNKFY